MALSCFPDSLNLSSQDTEMSLSITFNSVVIDGMKTGHRALVAIVFTEYPWNILALELVGLNTVV